MKKAVFKTNINCSSCVAKVTPFLEAAGSVTKWEVDTENKDKLLTVEGPALNVNEVTTLVQHAGYTIEEKGKGLRGLFG